MQATRLRTALDRVDARRIEIERQIVADLEEQFSQPRSCTDVDVSEQIHTEADTVTLTGSPFTFRWYGMG